MTDESVSAWRLLGDWLRRPRTRPRDDLVQRMEDLIEEGTAEGVLNEDEEEMLRSVLSFRRTRVREVMVPRTEVVFVEDDQPLEILVQVMVEEGHSRVPVCRGGFDRVLGFLTSRDVLRFWNLPGPHPPLSEVVRPAFFVPETLHLERLLGEFQRRRVHLAIAVDEYGGASGLVTLEDVLEEIVGEIEDEYDDEVVDMHEAVDGLRVDARTEIERVEERLEVELGGEDEFETVGGLVFHVLGHVPRPGETFAYRGLEITVRDADRRRVKEVTIRTPTPRIPDGESNPSPIPD